MKPIDYYILNLLAAPVLLLFLHWARPSFRWLKVFLVSAPLSWLLVNSINALYPPENGFVSVVYVFIGWIWLPPLCAGLWLFEWITFKILGISKDSPMVRKLGLTGSVIFGMLMAGFTAWGVCGRISASAALEQADLILREYRYVPTQPDAPQWINDHWIIRYPGSTFGVIALDRNGRMSWINGP